MAGGRKKVCDRRAALDVLVSEGASSCRSASTVVDFAPRSPRWIREWRHSQFGPKMVHPASLEDST